MLTLRGSGIEKVEECVNKLTNNKTHKIIKIESEAKINLGNEKKIIIGTEAAFKFIDWSQIDLIVFLSTDSQMFLPEYMAFEHVWHLIRKTQYNKSEKSKFIIQTNYPEHLIFRSLAEPDRFYRTELNLRRSLLYPPYSYLIKYFYGSPDYESSKREAERMLAVLAEALTVEKKKVKITGPVEMQPKFYRQKYWHAILVKSENASHKDNLLWLNKFFSASWKVDPRPISLLSP
jgi:primosomal protein N' (replication factor Y)